jgi:hypothetical protein
MLRIAAVVLAFLLGGGVYIPFKDDGAKQPNEPARRRPIFPLRRPILEPAEAAARGGTTSPDGKEEIQCDLPKQFHLKNVGGTDGAGLCVWASMQHTATWQRIPAIDGVFKYMQTQRGGGWPDRVDKVVPVMAQRNKEASPKYIQVESRTPLEVLKLACKTGRMPGVTYSYSPTGNYGGSYIAHMVSLVHASDNWFAILDNNYPNQIEWMDPQTFLKVHTRNGRELGWSYTFLSDPPPPPPCN